MSEFDKWLKRNLKDYSFTKYRKDFGQRQVGKYERGAWHNDRMVLVYNFAERKPTVEDFSSFLKDFEKFCEQYAGDYEIDGAYFVVYGEYDKKAFALLVKGIDEELRGYVKIKMLEAPRLKSKEFQTFGESKDAARKKIFVVHGREKTPALELSRFIERKYPIDAIFLEEQAHRGRTLIEKLEDYSNVDFAFIALTPDDVGALKGGPLKERGRQNVIFELGQFIGRIGRKRVCLIIQGEIEIPSDLHGIGYYRFYKNVKECFADVENELEAARLI